MSRWSLIAAVLLPGLLASSCGAAASPSPAGTRSFSGWTGTCDNLGACVAIGTAADLFYVRITRAAGATADLEVKIVLVSATPLEGAAPAFRLDVVTNGRPPTRLGPLPAKPIPGIAGFEARLEPGLPSLAFIASARDAARLDYAFLGARGSLDLTGLAATLRWIDARQGRAGTPTALVARGMTPIGQVPGPRETPVVVPAPVGSVVALAKPVLTPDLLRRAQALADCDRAVVASHDDAEAWRMGRDLVLVAMPCVRGAYNATSALYFTNAQGGSPRPVPLPQARAEDVATAENVVTNMRFDPTTMVLSDFAKGRGAGDCGETRTFVWTGRIFALLAATGLDACPGALAEDWPTLYKATLK